MLLDEALRSNGKIGNAGGRQQNDNKADFIHFLKQTHLNVVGMLLAWIRVFLDKTESKLQVLQPTLAIHKVCSIKLLE